MNQELKQVIVIRKDLNMRKGKMIVQGCHASTRVCMEIRMRYDSERGYHGVNWGIEFEQWYNGLQKKICVSVDSEAELMDVYVRAQKLGLPCALVKDAGLTEFKEETYTAVAIGPAPGNLIDPVTGHLKLL